MLHYFDQVTFSLSLNFHTFALCPADDLTSYMKKKIESERNPLTCFLVGTKYTKVPLAISILYSFFIFLFIYFKVTPNFSYKANSSAL